MKILRWLLFIPISIIAAAALSAGIRMVSGMIVPDIMGNIISGLFGGVGLVMVGFRIAPVANRFTKWSLIVVTIIIGVAASLGSFMKENQEDETRALQGIFMAVMGIILIKKPVKEIEEGK